MTKALTLSLLLSPAPRTGAPALVAPRQAAPALALPAPTLSASPAQAAPLVLPAAVRAEGLATALEAAGRPELPGLPALPVQASAPDELGRLGAFFDGAPSRRPGPEDADPEAGSLAAARTALFAAAGGDPRSGRAELASLTGEGLLAYVRSAPFRDWVASERAGGRRVFWAMDLDKTMVFADSYPLFFAWRAEHHGFTSEQEERLRAFLGRTGLVPPAELAALDAADAGPSRRTLELWETIVTKQPNGLRYLDFVNEAYWMTQKGLTRAEKDAMMRGFAAEYAALVPPVVIETNRALADAGVDVVLLSTAEDEFLPYAAALVGIDPRNAAQGSALEYGPDGRATGLMDYHDIDDKAKEWSGRKPLPGKYLHFMEWLERSRARWPGLDRDSMVIAAMNGDSADFDGGFMYFARPVLASFIVDTPGEPGRRKKFLDFAERWFKPHGLGSFVTVRFPR